MVVVNLTTKIIQIKPYTICNLYQLGKKFKDQSGALHSFFPVILRDERRIFSLRRFFSLHIQS